MAPRDDHEASAIIEQDNGARDSSTPVVSEPSPSSPRTVSYYHSAADVSEALAERDWELGVYNATTTVADPNNIDDETARLLCLKSYNMLDTKQEIEFELITQQAQKAFDCPIAVVSLVDMGRQWFKSIQGLPGVEETPRCLAFCAHVVKQKNLIEVMVVPDATKDVRFQNNPLVTGGPMIRFYAGTALLTPEGQRVGTLCIIDTKAHPEGLDNQEKRLLQSMAQEVVLEMILR
jgi:GAF domain-containing protein